MFVVGTTNFVDSLDPALLRPGRFEFMLQIPHPAAEDRREILQIYDKKMRLKMTDETLDYHIRELRGKLGIFSDFVQTVPYIGFRFKP